MKTLSAATFVIGALLLGACHGGGASRYDAEASAAYRAAWEKRRAGDDAGYRSGLAAVAARRGTWAGERAALDLELVDQRGARSLWHRLVEQAASIAGDPTHLGGGGTTMIGGPAAQQPPHDEAPAPKP